MINTDETLLDRLRAENAHDAWEEFYRTYATAVMHYAIRMGLDHARAQDVLQETMVVLMRLLPAFVYDRRRGRFRNFLLTIAHRRALDCLRRERRRGEVSLGETPTQALQESPAADWWDDALLAQAMENLRRSGRFDARSFAVFDEYALRRLPGADVAARFGLSTNAVYLLKKRMLRQLRSEVARLRRLCEPGTRQE